MSPTLTDQMNANAHMRSSVSRRIVAAVAVALVLVLPTTALAQNTPSGDQYEDSSGLVQQQVTGGGGGEASAPSGLGSRVGPLPFTGFDVIAMSVVALAVTGLGLGLQRAVSRQSSEL